MLASLPKQRYKCCLFAFHMTSTISLWFQMNIALWLIAHFTVLLTLLNGFFKMSHALHDYYSLDLLHLQY